MNRSRVADWFIGALGMLFLLAISLVVLWWVISEPADGSSQASPSATATRGAGGAATPPDDLGNAEVWLGEMDMQSARIELPDASLVDVEATGHGARSGPNGLVVAQLEVQATVPFADVAAQLGGDSDVRAAADGQAAVQRTVEVFGRQISVVATGTVDVVDGVLVVEPRSIDVGGPEALSRVIAAVVREFVTIQHPIEGLPRNLVLLDVEVQQNGFRADLAGQDVVLAEGVS